MRYSLTAAQQAILRTFPQKTEYYLAVNRPRTISRGNLQTVPSTYPGNSLSINNLVAGFNLADIRAGMTLYVGSEGTKYDYGMLRVRQDYIGSSLIEVASFGSGLINFQSGASLTVVEDYRVWPIHLSYDTSTSTWRVNEKAYANETKHYGPLAIMGPPYVGWQEDGKALASYVGDLTLQNSGSLTGQLWKFPNGQQVASAIGSSANPIVITYLNASPFGAYHSLTVSDDGATSHIGRRLSFVFGSGVNAPIDCRFEQISGGLKSGGYRTKIYVSEGAGSGTIVDGAKVVIFEKSSYGSITSSVGGNYFARDNIVLVGRVMADSQRIEPFTKDLSFDVETEDGELRRAFSYDVFLKNGSAASDWDMASGLTLDRAGIILAKYRSTIANVMDFHPASGAAVTNGLASRDLPTGFLWDQLNYNYAAVFGTVAVDMQGTLWAMCDTQVTGLSANIANVMAITAADRRDAVTIGHPHRDVNSAYRLYAVQGGTLEPLAAESPGDRVGYFGARQEISQNITANTQQELITWSGNVRARDNNPYNNIVIPLAGNMRIDPVPQSYVTMSLSSTQSPRSVAWNNQAIIPNEITLTYNPEGQYATSEISAEIVVNGIGGSAFTYPVSIIPPPPPPPHGDCQPGNHWDDTTQSCVPDDTGGFVVFGIASGAEAVIRSQNFLDTSPNYSGITGGITGTLLVLKLDPYDPANKAIVLSTSGVWYSTNIRSSIPTWTLSISAAQITSATEANIDITTQSKLFTTINSDGRVYIAVGGPISTATGVWIGVSSTYTSGTWTWTKVGTAIAGSTYGMNLHVAQYDSDLVLVSFRKTASTYVSLYYSTNTAASFSEKNFSSENFVTRDALIFATHLSGNNLIYMMTGTDLATEAGGSVRILKTTTGVAGTWSDISTTVGGEVIQFGADRESMTESPSSTGDNLFACVVDEATLGKTAIIKYDGNSWSTIQSLVGDTRWLGYGFGGWPYNNTRLQMHNAGFGVGHIGRSEDGGFSWTDATGDLLTVLPATTIVRSLVPVWVPIL